MACATPAHRTSPARARRGYTLLEMLLVVGLLAIAATLVVPAMGNTDILRVQAAVRTLVADMTFAQADALAFQHRRALVFDTTNNTLTLYEVNGTTLSAGDILPSPGAFGVNGQYIRDLNRAEFAGAALSAVDFDGGATLIFDEMGGPVNSLTGEEPALPGYVEISGSGQTFRINVEAYTGRITVQRTSP